VSGTQYKLSLGRKTTNGTSNISFLLDGNHEQWLETIKPDTVESVFGFGDEINIPSKGYTDPEWYWVASDGNVWGIGWRWGKTRLRGRGVRKLDQVVSHPDKLTAYEFIEFLQEALEGKESQTREES
jgi:hypothetical protein